MSHISRPIPAYLIHNIQKSMIDYNHSPFDTKKVYMFWLCSNIIQDNNKTKQAGFDSHLICGPMCGLAACNGDES